MLDIDLLSLVLTTSDSFSTDGKGPFRLLALNEKKKILADAVKDTKSGDTLPLVAFLVVLSREVFRENYLPMEFSFTLEAGVGEVLVVYLIPPTLPPAHTHKQTSQQRKNVREFDRDCVSYVVWPSRPHGRTC